VTTDVIIPGGDGGRSRRSKTKTRIRRIGGSICRQKTGIKISTRREEERKGHLRKISSNTKLSIYLHRTSTCMMKGPAPKEVRPVRKRIAGEKIKGTDDHPL